MKYLFRKLPLALKLALIGLTPLLVILYLSLQVFQQRNDRLNALQLYVDRVHESANLSALIDALQTERKVSFDYIMGKAVYQDVCKSRPVTDNLLQKVDKSNDPVFRGFRQYTYIDRLLQTRKSIDAGNGNQGLIMHNYSNTIFRLNTLSTVPTTRLLQPVYQDMVAQKLLAEMSTYLGIIRANVYNVLVTRKYMVETLMGTLGTYDVYKSYAKEFLIKSSKEAKTAYLKAKTATALKPTDQYLDSLFRRFSFDSTLTADSWWQISNDGVGEISRLQKNLWTGIENRIHSVYGAEKASRDRAFAILAAVVGALVLLVVYTIVDITQMLKDLKLAAQKISKGVTTVNIEHHSDDVIGSLSDCIMGIARSDYNLAEAAKAIGSGNFQVKVLPRSEEDVLANAIIQMKEALHAYSQKMEALVNQRTEALESSNLSLQQFAHVISHDLKEPLRKIRTFSDRLQLDGSATLSENSKNYLAKVVQSAGRMTQMIDGILAYSSLSATSEPFEMTDLNNIAQNIKSDLELLIEQKNATVVIGNLPQIEGAPVLLNQLLYNLLNNALKFSREDVQPRIEIEARKLQGEDCLPLQNRACYEISVHDNGIGFDAQYAEKIFESFSRLHSQAKYEGTGLGLALCRKIVEYHHGKIWAESNPDGATFRILLPQRQEK